MARGKVLPVGLFALLTLTSCPDFLGVPEEKVIPAAPARFTAASYADDVLVLRWEDVSEMEDGWIVERSGEMEGDSFTIVSTLPRDTEEFRKEKPEPGRYRLSAFNGSSRSEYLAACLYYEDRDGDGYGADLSVVEGPCPTEGVVLNGGDCDESDPKRSPGAKELCDGVDNNCNNRWDEEFGRLGQGCSTSGVGECVGRGTIVCTPDGVGVVCDAVRGTPSPEVCDKKDNDCDGKVDEVDGCVLPVVAVLPSSRMFFSCAAANEKIYCFGGYGQTYAQIDEVFEFDPVAGATARLSAALPSERSSLSCGATQGKIYCLGGVGPADALLDEVVEFDPVSKTVVRRSAALPSARGGSSCAVADGMIYCLGGGDTSKWLDEIVRYDPAKDEMVRESARLPSGRLSFSCATLSGKIYCFGGRGPGDELLDEVVELDPVAGTAVRRSARLPSARAYLSCAAAGGMVYCFGGSTPKTIFEDVVEYDPSRDKLERKATKLPSARAALSCVTPVEGKIYCLGGGGSSFGALDQIVEYDVQKYQLAPSSEPVVRSPSLWPDLEDDPALGPEGDAFGCSAIPFGPAR